MAARIPDPIAQLLAAIELDATDLANLDPDLANISQIIRGAVGAARDLYRADEETLTGAGEPDTQTYEHAVGTLRDVLGTGIATAHGATDTDASATDAADVDADHEVVADEDPEDALRAEVNAIEAAIIAATAPHDIVLNVRRKDGFTLTVPQARLAIDMVLPTLTSELGELEVTELHEGDEDDLVQVTLTAADGNTALGRLGAGRDGFNADLPLIGVGLVSITSRVGDVDDPEAAAECGVLPPELPEVPEGQHPINGVLGLLEEAFGERPEAEPQFTVTYSKNDGTELTDAEVATIAAHPVSTHGLRRFGQVTLRGVNATGDKSVKVAVFDCLNTGTDIDLATLAVRATAYKGTFDFGGTIGSVTANGEAALADIDAYA